MHLPSRYEYSLFVQKFISFVNFLFNMSFSRFNGYDLKHELVRNSSKKNSSSHQINQLFSYLETQIGQIA